MSIFRASLRFAPFYLLSSLGLLACGSSPPAQPGPGDQGGGATGGAAAGGAAAGGASSGGATAQAGSSTGGTSGGGGANPAGGMTSSGGAAGASAGAGGAAASAGASGIGMDQLPSAPLNVTAPPALYHHTNIDAKGNDAGVDTRAAKMAGKLVVDLAVTQGHYNANLGKRGFHSMGVLQVNTCPDINGSLTNANEGPPYDGDCRLNTLDGMPHGAQSTVSVADSIITQVTSNLKSLDAKYPTEDWGYFLNPDGSVRWSDVAWTGYSHGATSAVLFAFTLRSYRAVAMSGPRDNICGTGAAKGEFDPANPPYDPACPSSKIAAWLALAPATPIDRFFSFVGEQDSEYGDIMFAAEHLHFVGMPTNISTGTAPYGGSHRFVALTGHSDFSTGFDDAVNIAFGVLPENLNPTF